MLKDVIEVKAIGGCRLWLRFEDGVQGEVDVAALVPFEGVFTSLRDPAVFASVRVNPEIGTVLWSGGADLDPDGLYALIKGEPRADLSRHRANVSTA